MVKSKGTARPLTDTSRTGRVHTLLHVRDSEGAECHVEIRTEQEKRAFTWFSAWLEDWNARHPDNPGDTLTILRQWNVGPPGR